MYNTKTDMKASKKSQANLIPKASMNPRQTKSPSKVAPHNLQGMKKSNQISLLQLHRRMTIIGQTKNLSMYQAAAADTDLSIKFTTKLVERSKEQQEQQRQLELSSFYRQRANSAEQVKVLNFFMEVSKDLPKYRVPSPMRVVHSSNLMTESFGGSQKSKKTSFSQKQLTLRPEPTAAPKKVLLEIPGTSQSLVVKEPE